jgi:hypothetical protein
MVILLALSPFIDRLADTPLQLQMYGEYSVWLVVAMAIWLIAFVAGMLMARSERKLGAVTVLALGSLLAVQIGISGYNTIARERSAFLVAEAIKPLVKAGAPFYSVLCYEQTLPFYLKRTFTLVDFQDEMDFGIKQEPERWIPSVTELAKRWSTQDVAYAIVPTQSFNVLQQQGIVMKEIYRDEQYVVVSKI